jgi:hypothetical protein
MALDKRQRSYTGTEQPPLRIGGHCCAGPISFPGRGEEEGSGKQNYALVATSTYQCCCRIAADRMELAAALDTPEPC